MVPVVFVEVSPPQEPARGPATRRDGPSGDRPQRGTAALLAGCVMDPRFGAVHDATIDLLAAAGYAVIVPEDRSTAAP